MPAITLLSACTTGNSSHPCAFVAVPLPHTPSKNRVIVSLEVCDRLHTCNRECLVGDGLSLQHLWTGTGFAPTHGLYVSNLAKLTTLVPALLIVKGA